MGFKGVEKNFFIKFSSYKNSPRGVKVLCVKGAGE